MNTTTETNTINVSNSTPMQEKRAFESVLDTQRVIDSRLAEVVIRLNDAVDRIEGPSPTDQTNPDESKPSGDLLSQYRYVTDKMDDKISDIERALSALERNV